MEVKDEGVQKEVSGGIAGGRVSVAMKVGN